MAGARRQEGDERKSNPLTLTRILKGQSDRVGLLYCRYVVIARSLGDEAISGRLVCMERRQEAESSFSLSVKSRSYAKTFLFFYIG